MAAERGYRHLSDDAQKTPSSVLPSAANKKNKTILLHGIDNILGSLSSPEEANQATLNSSPEQFVEPGRPRDLRLCRTGDRTYSVNSSQMELGEGCPAACNGGETEMEKAEVKKMKPLTFA